MYKIEELNLEKITDRHLLRTRISKYISHKLKKILKHYKKYKNITLLDNSEIDNIIGLTLYGLAKNIESKWVEDMSWDNYGSGIEKDRFGIAIRDNQGRVNKVKQWNVDHIKCIGLINSENIEKIKVINYYTNLTPLWANDNYRKINKTKLCPEKDHEILNKYKELQVLTY